MCSYLHSAHVPVCDRTIVAESGDGVYVNFWLTMSDLGDELRGATNNPIYLVKIVNGWYPP